MSLNKKEMKDLSWYIWQSHHDWEGGARVQDIMLYDRLVRKATDREFEVARAEALTPKGYKLTKDDKGFINAGIKRVKKMGWEFKDDKGKVIKKVR